MQGETKGEGLERAAGGEKHGDSAMNRKNGITKHREKIMEGVNSVAMCSD